MEILNRANLFTSHVIGGGASYSPEDVLYILIPALVGTALFTLGGVLIFRKKDLK